MEPTVETLVLHPAILIASGFESITSRQVRFLNAHRRHFHTSTVDFHQTISITPEHFELGRILNPYGYFQDTRDAYNASAEEVKDFPYLTRRAILKYYYAEHITSIWSELMMELFSDLSLFCVQHKRSREYFIPNTKVIHALYPYPIYHKISALHLCGLGSKLMDAFSYVFEQFYKYESRHAKAKRKFSI